MAISSICSTTLSILPLMNSSSSSEPKSPLFSSTPFKPLKPLKTSFSFTSNSRLFEAFAAPELLNSSETTQPLSDSVSSQEESDTPGTSPSAWGADADMMAPKQKIRIKLKSYYVSLIEDSAKQIMDAARTTNAKIVGPVPLPTKKRVFCVLKSPHVHKDARFHFEIRTHQRLIDIFYPTAQTIDALMQLDLPAGVDVQVKV